MGISLLIQLDELSWNSNLGQFDTAFFLTYSINLRFFEQLVLPRLKRLGVVHIGIIVDDYGYQASLDDPLGQEQCGKSYVLGTCPKLTGLQHAKMLWLHGDRDLVYMGSHNLTMAGFNDQLEITSCLDSVDISHRHALRGIHQAVSSLTNGAGYLQEVWSKISEPPDMEGEPTAYFLWSGEHGLLHQMADIVGEVMQLRVVTPFLDPGALAMLRARVKAKDVILDLPHEGADTPLADTVAVIPSLVSRRVAAGRRLHGKAYWFASSKEQWLALGSANCTYAGLVKGVPEGGNVEFLLVLPGGILPDDEIKPERIENVADFPSTGSRWDEKESTSRLFQINSAEYGDGVLTVNWKTNSNLTSVNLVCGEQRHSFTGSPIQIRLERVPSVVVLEASVVDEVARAQAWVTFTDELRAQELRSHARRWHDYMESEDTEDQARGIDFYFLQLLRDLMSTEAELHALRGDIPRPSDSDVQGAIEVFTFSRDQQQIAKAAAVLVSGDPSIDPLGALRGLVTRLRATPPPSIEGDEIELDRYEMRRQRAEQRIADRLLVHLNSLSSSAVDWAFTPSQRIVTCLRGTFEATVLLWSEVISDDPRISIPERLLQSFVHLLNTCLKFDNTRAACQDIGVAGPLVLAIGVAAGAAPEMEWYNKLQQQAKNLVSDPQVIFNTWLQNYGGRARLLLAHARGGTNLEFWLRQSLRLLGQVDPLTRGRQESRWGLLLKVYNAEYAGDASVSNLYEEADRQYGFDETWQKYKEIRSAGGMPKLKWVTKAICSGCHLEPPSSIRTKLERGDAVFCPNPNCNTILLWGNP